MGKIFFAGADDKVQSIICRISGVENMLCSYYHAFKQGQDQKALDSFSPRENENWIVDSGLFTMMFGAGKGKTYTKKDLLDYTKKYINTWKHKKDYSGTIVEMDVHKILGMDSVHEFRKIFEDNFPLERTMFVYHIEEVMDGLRKIAKKYPYIALSIPELRIITKNKAPIYEVIKYYLSIIYKENPQSKVHLLGNTQVDLIKGLRFFSCDSTSWNVWFWNTGEFAFFDSENGKMSTMKITELDALRIKSLLEKFQIQHGKPLSKAGEVYTTSKLLSIQSYLQLNTYINATV